MNMLGNANILTKILGIIALIAVIVAGSIWFATSRMTRIDDAYSQMIRSDARASVEVRRANRLVNAAMYRVFRMIAESDAAQIKVADDAFRDIPAMAKKALDLVRLDVPAFTSRIDAASKTMDLVFVRLSEVRRLAALDDNTAALAVVHDRIDPLFGPLSAEISAIADDLQAGMNRRSEELAEQNNAARYTTMALSGGGLAFGIAIAFLVVVAGITRPLGSLVKVIDRMAKGDFSAEIAEAARGDEIGAVGRAVVAIKHKAAEQAAVEAEAKRRGDDAATGERRQAMHAMADTFEGAVGGILQTVTSAASELQATARTMTVTASETARQSTTVAAAAEEASTNVTMVSAAAEELGSSVNEIGRQVDGSADLARIAVEEAAQTGRLVRELSDAASQIGDVVALISNIAGQTNLLALNATIEAARAGEAGRGFAVVATEVKELASQTAKATDEIAGQITRIQTSTGLAVTAISGITDRIREISAVATTLAAAVEEQGAATQEIVRNVTQAAIGTGEVTATISGVAGAAEETGAAASHVLSSATELSRQATTLGIEVGHFLSTVRAA